jgi:hypothetical protein
LCIIQITMQRSFIRCLHTASSWSAKSLVHHTLPSKMQSILQTRQNGVVQSPEVLLPCSPSTHLFCDKPTWKDNVDSFIPFHSLKTKFTLEETPKLLDPTSLQSSQVLTSNISQLWCEGTNKRRKRARKKHAKKRGKTVNLRRY